MPTVLFGLLFLATTLFTLLRVSKVRHFRRLLHQQAQLVARHGPALPFPSQQLSPLPTFEKQIAVLINALPDELFKVLRDQVGHCRKVERSYFPGHKQGGTIAYESLHEVAPQIVAFYQSDYLRKLCSSIIGEPVVPTPIHDQSSCSILFYEKAHDHIGWHYDYNFYQGRHFTVLLPLINQHNAISDQPASAKLVIKNNGQDKIISTLPNTLILFEGARVYHKVTRLGPEETRVILSMTFCTNPKSSVIKNQLRRIKDTAYFGIRALWT